MKSSVFSILFVYGFCYAVLALPTSEKKHIFMGAIIMKQNSR